MNKCVRKLILLLAAVLMATVCFVFSASAAASETSGNKCTECSEGREGLVCSINEQYILKEKFDATPLTFEAVFTVGSKDLKDTTTILGSDGSFYPAISFTLNKNGQPKVMIRNKTHYSKQYVYTFDKVNVATEKRVHLSIVMDFAAKKLHCYINGELMQTVNDIACSKPYKDKYNMIIGGDYNDSNATFFTGKIESIAMWSDVRTVTEIATDYTGGVSVSDENLLAYYDFTLCDKCMVNDLSVNGINLEHIVLWQEKEKVEPVTDYEYSFAVVGDTQKMCANDPDAMSAVYDWIIDNKDSQKIKYVVGLGDITDNSTDEEWEFSLDTIGKLNDKIPYILVRGNHDEWDDFNRHLHDGYYDKHLSGLMNSRDVDLSDPVGQPGVLKKVASDGTVSYITRMGDIPRGGVVKGDLTNSYQCIKIEDTDYIFVTLDFAPHESVLEWVDEVLTAHPDHKAIIVTHAYMFHDGTSIGLGDSTPPSQYDGYTKAQNGEDIWEKCLSKHSNVMMVLSGHDPWQHIVYRQDLGSNGNTVTQMLINPQGLDADLGGTGMVAMFYFSENGETLTVRYYSVVKDCYGSELSQFTVHLNHDYKKVSEVKASCEKAGKIIERCFCGEENVTTVAKLPHTEVKVPGKTATCKNTGLTDGKKCSVCDAVTLAQKTVGKKAHTYDDACDTACNVCSAKRSITHSYKNVTAKATLSKNGRTEIKCSVCGNVKSTTPVYYPKTIKLSKTAYTYNGRIQTPSVEVKDSKGNTLKNGTDCTVKYENGRTAPGRYNVKITFKGKYSGTKTLTYTIAPKVTGKVSAFQSTKAIKLTWSKVTGATGYRIYQYNAKSKKWEKIKTLTGTSFKVQNLKAGTTYKFRIKAYKNDAGTIWGKATSTITVATKPVAPKITKLTTLKGEADFVWSDVAGESGYQVYYSTKKDSGFKKVGSYKADVTKGSKSKLTKGKKYYFKVRAYKTVGDGKVYSAWSAVKSVKIK